MNLYSYQSRFLGNTYLNPIRINATIYIISAAKKTVNKIAFVNPNRKYVVIARIIHIIFKIVLSNTNEKEK